MQRPQKTITYVHTWDQDAHDDLQAALEVEKKLTLELARRGDVDAPRGRMSDTRSKKDIETELEQVRARMDEARARMAAGAVRITLTGLTRMQYRAMCAQHAPRDGEKLDKELGVNVDTFGDELIRACITATTMTDGEKVPNEWDRWADDMTDGQWWEVFMAALEVNRGGSPSIPPSRAS